MGCEKLFQFLKTLEYETNKRCSHVSIKLDSTKSTKLDMIDTHIIKPLNENYLYTE